MKGNCFTSYIIYERQLFMDFLEYKMSFRAIYLYRLRIVIIAVITAFICGGFMVFSLLSALIFTVLAFSVLTVLFFIYPSLLYRRYSIKFTNDKICITKGVVFLRKYYTNLANINYVSLVTTPLQKIFGIFSLCLYTKSGQIYLNNIENIPNRLKGFTNE